MVIENGNANSDKNAFETQLLERVYRKVRITQVQNIFAPA